MKLSPTLTLAELVVMLRKTLAEKLNCEVEEITITSYDKPVLHIGPDNLVVTREIKHRA